MREEDATIQWLLEGDVSIRYQVCRDLLGEQDRALQQRIATQGWGAEFLAKRHADGHWGRAYYQPKWTSTHYTLQDLKNLNISPDNPLIRETLMIVLRDEKSQDGGIKPVGRERISDVCINGMFLNFASYFRMEESSLASIVDSIISRAMGDGGFNCLSHKEGTVHSSLHSTLSVAEGIAEYRKNGYTYRLEELAAMEASSQEFILRHRLFKSDKTGEVIDKKMLMLSYPSRWRFDLLRALDYFQSAGCPYDRRMEDALAVLLKKRSADGRWPLQARHPGATHFEMEAVGMPSRWNTLRALRVLNHFGGRIR